MGQHIEALAEFAATTRWDNIPEPIQMRAKLALLDTIGVILAGSLRPEVEALCADLAGCGGTGATILGPGMLVTDPRTAAMLNAIAGRSVELCDGLRGVQPSVQIVPGLLAAGELRQSSGRDMLTAFVTGYEVAGRLALGFTPRAFAHSNGQVALLACAAAGARLRGFDGAGISRTMRIATTMLMAPSYTNTVAGARALNLPAGLSGVASVLVPELALAGDAAQDEAIEEALGKMVGGGFDPIKVTDGLGSDWQIAGSYFRFYACCNPIHPALDCLQDAFAALRPEPEAIDRIDVETHAFASVMRNPEPANYSASKYSPHAARRGGAGGPGRAWLRGTGRHSPERSGHRRAASSCAGDRRHGNERAGPGGAAGAGDRDTEGWKAGHGIAGLVPARPGAARSRTRGAGEIPRTRGHRADQGGNRRRRTRGGPRRDLGVCIGSDDFIAASSPRLKTG